MGKPFRECHVCGARLDPGEPCDCESTPAIERAEAETERITPPERAYYGRVVSADLVRGGGIELAFRDAAKTE